MSATTLAQPDDNLIPGQTYTFQMNSSGFQWPPSTSDVTTALINNAPGFVSNLQVTSPFTTTLYNCQFNYTGDGSDVVSDVGAELITALSQGLGKTFTFVGAVPDTATTITVNPGTAVQKTVDSVTDAVNSGINKVVANTTATVGQGAQNLLTPVEVAVGIVALLLVILIFTAGKSGGVSGGPGGFSVGGK